MHCVAFQWTNPTALYSVYESLDNDAIAGLKLNVHWRGYIADLKKCPNETLGLAMAHTKHTQAQECF